jgi:hypothetical protein
VLYLVSKGYTDWDIASRQLTQPFCGKRIPQQGQIAKQQEKINDLETTLKKHVKALSPPSKSRASGLRRIIHRVKVEKPSLSPIQIAIRVDRVLEASKTELAAVCPKSWANKKKQLPRSLQDALRDPALKKLVAPMISKA